MDSKAKKRVTALLSGLRAVLDEAGRRGIPDVAGFQVLVEALEKLLANDESPVSRLLGLEGQGPGRPGHDFASQLEKLQRFRELQAQGLSRANAAKRLGVSVRTIARWRNEAAGIAEELCSKLGPPDLVPSARSESDKTWG